MKHCVLTMFLILPTAAMSCNTFDKILLHGMVSKELYYK